MRFATCLLALVAACQPVPNVKHPTAQELAKAAILNSVGLAAQCSDGSLQFGSGTAIGPGTVLTARHVLTCDDGAPVAVMVEFTSADGTKQAMATGLQGLSNGGELQDAALVTVAGDPFAYVARQGSAPGLGDTVCLNAYIPRHFFACSQVAEVRGFEADHAQAVYPGNSGGGVYDDQGYLVGITVQSIYCHNHQGAPEVCGGVVLLLAGAKPDETD